MTFLQVLQFLEPNILLPQILDLQEQKECSHTQVSNLNGHDQEGPMLIVGYQAPKRLCPMYEHFVLPRAEVLIEGALHPKKSH